MDKNSLSVISNSNYIDNNILNNIDNVSNPNPKSIDNFNVYSPLNLSTEKKVIIRDNDVGLSTFFKNNSFNYSNVVNDNNISIDETKNISLAPKLVHEYPGHYTDNIEHITDGLDHHSGNLGHYKNINNKFIGKNVTNSNKLFYREYTLFINSIDRDITRYPSPFTFHVSLNPIPSDVNASIPKQFKNVKNLRLSAAILPDRYITIANTVTTLIDETIIVNESLFSIPVWGNKNYSVLNDNSISPYVIIWAFSDESYIVSFTLSNSSSVYNIDYLFYNYNKSRNYCYSNSNVTSNMLSYLNSGNYSIGSSKIFDDYTLTISNIVINSHSIIYNYCQTLDINTLISEVYYYEHDIINNTFKRTVFKMGGKSLKTMGYTNVNISDIKTNNYSTNNNNDNTIAIVIPAEDIKNSNFYFSEPRGEIIFNDDNLAVINNLHINIQDMNSNNIIRNPSISTMDFTIDLDKNCKCLDGIRNYSCVCSYIRHPYYYTYQTHFILKIKVLETEFNKIHF